MLQRIYGTAWESQEALNNYLIKLKEASRRDHRKLGASLNLFFFHHLAPAMPFFQPKGTILMNLLIQYMREKYEKYQYKEVITPQIFDSKIWDLSGHSTHFKDNMFFTETENKIMALKPMNCPSHALIFKSQLRSYKELPIRIADFGRLHRNERSGVSHGLTRVKSFSQDDAHIFCQFQQIESEINNFLIFMDEIYSDFGFKNLKFFLSLRPESRSGKDLIWDESEKIMTKILVDSKRDFTVQEGEGAFYGPKIDVTIPDALDREWQLGTIQLDFFLSEKFGLNYIDNDNSKKQPVVLHRAIFGSLERFLGVLIEHYGGSFPLWLSPDQYVLIPVSENHLDYCGNIDKKLKSFQFRGYLDKSSERLNAKIRNAQLNKIPLMIICGEKEVSSSTLTVRLRNGQNLEQINLNSLKNLRQNYYQHLNDQDISKTLNHGNIK